MMPLLIAKKFLPLLTILKTKNIPVITDPVPEFLYI